MDNKIVYLSDFYNFPINRYCKDGDKSGEEWYHTVLNKEFYKAFTEDYTLIINLNGGSSLAFLKESFENLVYDFGKKIVMKYVSIECDDEPDILEFVYDQIIFDWNGQEPIYTVKHNDWFRLVDGKMLLVNKLKREYNSEFILNNGDQVYVIHKTNNNIYLPNKFLVYNCKYCKDVHKECFDIFLFMGSNYINKFTLIYDTYIKNNIIYESKDIIIFNDSETANNRYKELKNGYDK